MGWLLFQKFIRTPQILHGGGERLLRCLHLIGSDLNLILDLASGVKEWRIAFASYQFVKWVWWRFSPTINMKIYGIEKSIGGLSHEQWWLLSNEKNIRDSSMAILLSHY